MKLIFSLALVFSVFSLGLFSQEDDEIPKSNVPKAFNVDFNYGFNGFGTGIGLRYWHISAGMALTGFANYIPGYTNQYLPNIPINPYSPLPSGFEESKYTKVLVSGDLSIYLNTFAEFTFVGSIGYYSQADTVLAKDINTGFYYFYKTEVNSGICFGAGFDYEIREDISFGIMAHTRRGIIARLIYIWF